MAVSDGTNDGGGTNERGWAPAMYHMRRERRGACDAAGVWAEIARRYAQRVAAKCANSAEAYAPRIGTEAVVKASWRRLPIAHAALPCSPPPHSHQSIAACTTLFVSFRKNLPIITLSPPDLHTYAHIFRHPFYGCPHFCILSYTVSHVHRRCVVQCVYCYYCPISIPPSIHPAALPCALSKDPSCNWQLQRLNLDLFADVDLDTDRNDWECRDTGRRRKGIVHVL